VWTVKAPTVFAAHSSWRFILVDVVLGLNYTTQKKSKKRQQLNN
jgi:hypothetical protein